MLSAVYSEGMDHGMIIIKLALVQVQADGVSGVDGPAAQLYVGRAPESDPTAALVLTQLTVD